MKNHKKGKDKKGKDEIVKEYSCCECNKMKRSVKDLLKHAKSKHHNMFKKLRGCEHCKKLYRIGGTHVHGVVKANADE